MSRETDFLSVIDKILGVPERRYVGAMAPTSQERTVGVGRMFVRMPDSTMIGVDTADYVNGGLR